MNQDVGPGLLWAFGLIRLLCTVGAFWLLSPTPMLGPDTRASTRNEMGAKAINAPGSDQMVSTC